MRLGQCTHFSPHKHGLVHMPLGMRYQHGQRIAEPDLQPVAEQRSYFLLIPVEVNGFIEQIVQSTLQLNELIEYISGAQILRSAGTDHTGSREFDLRFGIDDIQHGLADPIRFDELVDRVVLNESRRIDFVLDVADVKTLGQIEVLETLHNTPAVGRWFPAQLGVGLRSEFMLDRFQHS